MDNVIIANFNGHLHAVTDPLWRYDEGMRLQFEGVDLPAAYQVHFANEKDGDAIPVYGDETGAEIPYELLEDGYNVYAWVYVTGDGYGRTKYVAQIPVMIKARPSEEEPSPVQQSALDEAINAVNEAAENLESAIENIPSEINAALTEAKESGEFDGTDGSGMWYTTARVSGSENPFVRRRDLIGREGATVQVHDLLFAPDVGDEGEPTTLYEIVSVGTACTLKRLCKMQGEGGGCGVTVDDDFSETSENPVQNKVITAAFNTALQQLQALGLALDNKVDKVSGKGLSTNDFTDSDKAKLDDAASEQWVTNQGFLTNSALSDYRTAAQQDTIDNAQNAAIAAKYSKPASGIPKTDMAEDVQTSLSKADTALQQHQSLAAYRTSQAQDEIDRQQNTAIEAKYTKPSGGIPATDLAAGVIPTVPSNVSAFTNDAGYLTQHQDISGKLDKAQGAANAGKFLVVGSDGNITTVTMSVWQGGSF